MGLRGTANQRLVVPVVYIAAMFMSVMDTTIVNVALPAIGRGLDVRAGSVGLVSIAYLVSLTVFIPVSGWLGDRIGGRAALLGAIGIFTIASALCGIATSLPELVGFLILQGLGAAVMTPVGLAILFRVYPPAERVAISTVIAVFVSLGPALGPVLGGLLTSYVSWRAVFFVNVPVGVAAFVYGALLLSRHAQPAPGRLDVRGLALSGLGLGAAMYGVSEGPVQGWASPTVLAALAVGVALLAAMVAVELRSAHPLVDLRLFTNRLFAATTSLYALGSVAYLGALYLAALFLQDALGLSALQAGLAIFPSALGVMAGSQLITRTLYQRVGPRRIVIAGLSTVAATMLLMAVAITGTNLWFVRAIMFGLGLGVSSVFVPSQAASMATITKSQTGRASALYNTGKQLGSAVGVALVTTVLAATSPSRAGVGHAADLTPYHDGFLATAAAALAAVAVALTIRDRDAATTMIPRRHHANTERTPREPALTDSGSRAR